MIEEMGIGEANEVSELIQQVFDEFVGNGYSEEGNRIFSEFIQPDNIRARMMTGNFLLIAREDQAISGVIEVRDNNHISLFFVSSSCHRHGIGRELFYTALEKVRTFTCFIDVKSSPYAVDIYRKLGFVPQGELTENHGILYIPMKYEL